MDKIASMILLLVFSVGCTFPEKEVFEGESEHWKGKLEIVHGDSKEFYDLVITYKGKLEDLASMEQIIHTAEFGTTHHKQEINFEGNAPSEKSFDTVISQKDLEGVNLIEVKVEWLDQEETFEVVNR
ncbi:hypothetical protein [Gracilibacillus massiliensis]|uniref:hypothetical protein n=1 Tax=Gracilibacillus massiliensis TaxID=1564956 RepID=UPI00071CCAA7|nr:hypothetical protein [Gracilibacillus massiliensis]